MVIKNEQQLTTEEETTYRILIDGYNTIRHSKLWPRVSVEDLLEWERYKRRVVNGISEKLRIEKY